MREVSHLKAHQVLALEPTYEEAVSWVSAQMAGTWFTSHLLKLLSQADLPNREKLALGFPEVVFLFLWWHDGVQPDESFWDPAGTPMG